MTLRKLPSMSVRQKLGLGGALLLALGAAGGAGAVSLTRPPVEMAPTVVTAAAKLPQSQGLVTVRGKVAEVYGDRFIVQDASGRAMVDAGRAGERYAQLGAPVLVQGRFDDGQLKAHFLVDAAGQVAEVGPPPRGPHGPPHGHPGPGGPGGPGGPRGPMGGPGGPPPPPPPPPGGMQPPPPPPPGAGPAAMPGPGPMAPRGARPAPMPAPATSPVTPPAPPGA